MMDTIPKSKAQKAEPESEAPQTPQHLKLMGPAQTEFQTFMEQCIYFANLYWPNWNNYENPSSHIIPSVFYYKYPDVSDEAAQTVQEREILLRRIHGAANTTRDRLLTDRTSDIAEHIVFTALQQLVQEKVKAPFVVVHNLNIHNNQKMILQLFPVLDEEAFKGAFEKCEREYDFLIIGPHVGIIAIEVKSSQYTASKHFVATNKHLPEDYSKGLQQLQSVDALFCTLSACANIVPPDKIPIRKILFTPNLLRVRYDTWKNSIGANARQNVESLTNGVIQWFTEDMGNNRSGVGSIIAYNIWACFCAMPPPTPSYRWKPPLYSKLRKILETGTSDLPPRETIESYEALVSGIRSMVCLSGNIQIDTSHFSPNDAILFEHRRIDEANPLMGQKKTTGSKHSLLKPLDRTKLKYEPKLFYLSPDQQNAFEGPQRQFIIGVAGTGKTVILQAKALQLLSEGEEIVVFSSKNFKANYEQLFDSYGFDKYQCLTWPHEGFELLHRYFHELMEETIDRHEGADGNDFDSIMVRNICECVRKEVTSKMFGWLIGRNVMIDDATDPVFPNSPSEGFMSISSVYVVLTLMAYAKAVNSTKTTWVAHDALCHGFETTSSRSTDSLVSVKDMLGLERPGTTMVEELIFHKAILKQVMRCSESVYRVAYTENCRKHRILWDNVCKPILGHKIQGHIAVESIERLDSQSDQDAMNYMWDKILEALLDLSREGVDLANVAIIFGSLPKIPFSQSSIEIANVSIPLFSYCEVSSMEWPIVIFATVFPDIFLDFVYSSAYLRIIGNPRYRAMSRATTKLINIIVLYKMHDSTPLAECKASTSKSSD